LVATRCSGRCIIPGGSILDEKGGEERREREQKAELSTYVFSCVGEERKE
jgi:hypothetical protein